MVITVIGNRVREREEKWRGVADTPGDGGGGGGAEDEDGGTAGPAALG